MNAIPGLEVLELLGEGASGQVFRVRNRTGRECAVKVLNSAGLSKLERLRFKREFQILADLDHPHILKVYEFDETVPYFTMELVAGQCLDVWCKGQDRERLTACASQLLQALNRLHEAGIVHRDLKPANVMILEGPTAKLMDFGLAHMTTDERLTRTGAILGTPLYLAPELISGADPDPRADLYSLGMMLYEALGGEMPATGGTNLIAFLRSLLNWRPRPLSQCEAWLGSFVQRLLAVDPSERFSSAREADLALTGGGNGRAPVVPVASTQLFESALVGRERELDRIVNSLESGQGFLLALAGEPGAGKSRLLREAGRLGLSRGLQVYQSTCLEGDPTPYALFLPLLRQAIERILRSGKTLTEMLGASVPLLARLLPEFSESLPSLAELDPQTERARLYDLVVRLLLTLRSSPSALCLDDMHWADAASLDLLRYASIRLQTEQEPGLYPLAILLAYRVDEVPAGHALHGVLEAAARALPVERLAVNLLDQEQVGQVASSILGGAPVSAELSAQLAQACGGNPLYLRELLGGMRRENAIKLSEGHWVRAEELGHEVAPSMALLLEKRLSDLSETAQDLLTAAAVLGKKLAYSVLAGMFPGCPEERLVDALDELLRTRLLVERPSEGADSLAFYHDRIREMVLNRTGRARAQLLHRHAAAAYQNVNPNDDVLARHYLAGGDQEKARVHLRRAAEQARRAFASRKAIGYYQQLAELGGDKPEDQEVLADLYTLVGEAPTAIEIYQRLLMEESDPRRRVSLEKRRAVALRFAARYAESLESYLAVLRWLGISIPTRPMALHLSSLAKTCFSLPFLLHTPEPIIGQQTLDEVEEIYELVPGFFYFLPSYPNIDLLVKDVLMRHYLHAMRSRRAAQMARALMWLSLGFVHGKPWWSARLGQRLGQRALELVSRIEDPVARARVVRYVGWGHVLMTRFPEAQKLLGSALEVSIRLDDLYGRMEHHNIMAYGCLYQGRFQECVREAGECHALARLGKNQHYAMVGLIIRGLAQVMQGQLEEAEAALPEVDRWVAASNDSSIAHQASQMRGLILMHQGEPQRARECFRNAFAGAMAPFWEAQVSFRETEASAQLGDWPAVTRELAAWKRKLKGFPLLEAQWLRLRARLLIHQGSGGKAGKLLQQAAELAGSVGAIWEQGRSLATRAQLEGDSQALKAAQAMLEECGDRIGLRLLGLA